ncbi:MAG: RNA polymerase sigma factor [Planctomycetota bacterium]
MTSDHDLMQRLLEGIPEAFEELFKRYERPVFLRLLKIVRQESSAEDLLQEVFLRLWTCADQWRGTGSLAGWLLTTATRLALNHQRSLRRRRVQSIDVRGEPGEEEETQLPGWMIDAAALRPDHILEEEERRAALRRLTHALPEGQREVLRLVHEAGMEIREVAEELGIPPGTVKSRLHHARTRIARKLADPKERKEDS